MGEAILSGLLAQHVVVPEKVRIFEVSEVRRARGTELGVSVALSPEELVKGLGCVILATKPQDMGTALESLRPGFGAETLVVSVAAGISTAFIQGHLGESTRVARVMPNTPALIGAGAAGLAFSANATEDDVLVVESIFNAIGITERVTEEQIDAVTAVSGSGPAYFLYLAECLSEAGVSAGLSKEQATRLADQTLYGAGRLLFESEESAAELRERVTSKGGTTFAALESFRAAGLAGIVETAVKAAATRSKELGA